MMEIIRAWMVDLIETKGKTPKQVSREANLGADTVIKICNGTFQDINVGVLLRICKVLNVSPGMIINQLPEADVSTKYRTKGVRNARSRKAGERRKEASRDSGGDSKKAD